MKDPSPAKKRLHQRLQQDRYQYMIDPSSAGWEHFYAKVYLHLYL